MAVGKSAAEPAGQTAIRQAGGMRYEDSDGTPSGSV